MRFTSKEGFYLFLILLSYLSRNAAAGASIGDSLAEPHALAYASRTAYVSHA